LALRIVIWVGDAGGPEAVTGGGGCPGAPPLRVCLPLPPLPAPAGAPRPSPPPPPSRRARAGARVGAVRQPRRPCCRASAAARLVVDEHGERMALRKRGVLGDEIGRTGRLELGVHKTAFLITC